MYHVLFVVAVDVFDSLSINMTQTWTNWIPHPTWMFAYMYSTCVRVSLNTILFVCVRWFPPLWTQNVFGSISNCMTLLLFFVFKDQEKFLKLVQAYNMYYVQHTCVDHVEQTFDIYLLVAESTAIPMKIPSIDRVIINHSARWNSAYILLQVKIKMLCYTRASVFFCSHNSMELSLAKQVFEVVRW